MILIDGGSTHSFIQESLVSGLGLLTRDTTPLKVMVGNDQCLHCHQLYEVVPIAI